MAKYADPLQQGLGISWSTLLKSSDLTPSVQTHMAKVYATLAAGLVMCLAGAATGLALPQGYRWALPLLPSIIFVVFVTWLSMTPNLVHNQPKRQKLFAAAAFTNGVSLSPLVTDVLKVNPGILLTALVATTLVFACFSLAALLAKRRSYLYLGAVASSTLSFMIWWRFALWGFGKDLLGLQLELWVGLGVFLVYILVDTQMIVEKASMGERDHLQQALQLLVNFVAIFVRLAILLMRSHERKQARSRARKGRRGNDSE